MATSIELNPERRSVRDARSFVTDTLTQAGLDPWSAALLVTELATNVVDHARSPYTIDVDVQPAHIRIEVHDGSAILPAVVEAAEDAERGRGLALVERLALRWGAELHDTGKYVWFEVPKERIPDRP